MGKINEIDDWKRSMCIHMPISETNDNVCITPDGEKIGCVMCRYHVENVYRFDK
jgi:hypothetical protein